MAVESAADLAGFFEEEEFAEAAAYTPPGGGMAMPCSVIVNRGQGRRAFEAGRMDGEGSERYLWVRKAELAVVARGGTFAMLDEVGDPTGEAFRVEGLPKLDESAAIWAVGLLIVD